MLQMIGIDYEKADLNIRSLFAFQPSASLEGMQVLKNKYGLDGIVIISTCNRTEVYVSAKEEVKDLFALVCSLKKIDSEKYEKYVVERQNQDAIHHLFQLACGMKSKVFGEDQIITQVKTALLQAREVETTDAYLEKVFQGAITAAKKIKSQVHLTAVKASVIEEMKKVLQEHKKSLEGCKCLVIGNGEIGRLAATAMIAEKAIVTVTVRNYKTRQVEIPKGCKVVDYKDRLQQVKESEIIISATTSPHHTIKYEECANLFRDGKQRILIDLAVPRDISSLFSEEKDVLLYNIDTLGGNSVAKQDDTAMVKALDIIKEFEDKLTKQQQIQEFLSDIQTIGEISGEVAYKRIKKPLNRALEEQQQDEIEKLMRQGTQKTISSLLFDIKKMLPDKYWEECLKAMRVTVEEQKF